MCGICGVAFSDPARTLDRETLARMTRLMRHRGPDSEGFHTAPGVALGVRRLSIIDLDTGDQPISNEDGTVTLVCNGEIYNYVELRRELLARGHRFATASDVEVLVHLYEESGPGCVHRLRGMFAFALWDSRRRRLMLARDRLGIKPLYYAERGPGLSFGSEIKPILIASEIDPQLEVHALRDLFRLGFVLAPQTCFAGVRCLLPGHYLLCRDGTATLRKYWEVTFPPREARGPNMSAEQWAEALLEKLRESVRIHLRSDVPVGAWLSSGIDSSAIVALACLLTDRPVQTFSLAVEGRGYDEVTGKSTLPRFEGYALSHRELACGAGDFELFPEAAWHCENLSATSIELLQWLLARETAGRVKVVLTGEGSDEVFGGYARFWRDKLFRPLAGLPVGVRRLMILGPLLPRLLPFASQAFLAPREMDLRRYQRLLSLREAELPQHLLSADLRRRIAEAGGPEGRPCSPDGFQGWHPFAQLQYFDLTVRLPNFIVHNLDRMSMAHSVEARVPFLDHELVEFCAGIPPALKMRGVREKHILRRAVRELLPAPIVRRRKRGLAAPYHLWLRDKLPAFAEEMLSLASLRAKGYFHAPAVLELLKGQRAGDWRCAMPLMAVLAVQVWDELFAGGRWRGRAPWSP